MEQVSFFKKLKITKNQKTKKLLIGNLEHPLTAVNFKFGTYPAWLVVDDGVKDRASLADKISGLSMQFLLQFLDFLPLSSFPLSWQMLEESESKAKRGGL